MGGKRGEGKGGRGKGRQREGRGNSVCTRECLTCLPPIPGSEA